MLLVIDVGNTNTSLGVYREDVLLAHWRLTTNPSRTIDEYGVHARNLFALAQMDFKDIEAIAVASVVPPLNYLKADGGSLFPSHAAFYRSHNGHGIEDTLRAAVGRWCGSDS